MSTAVGSIVILVEAAIALALLSTVPAALGYGVCCAFRRERS